MALQGQSLQGHDGQQPLARVGQPCWQLELWDGGQGSRSGRSQSSQKQLSDLMACPVSLPSRKKGTIEMLNGCPGTPRMAEIHKPLLRLLSTSEATGLAGPPCVCLLHMAGGM